MPKSNIIGDPNDGPAPQRPAADAAPQTLTDQIRGQRNPPPIPETGGQSVSPTADQGKEVDPRTLQKRSLPTAPGAGSTLPADAHAAAPDSPFQVIPAPSVGPIDEGAAAHVHAAGPDGTRLHAPGTVPPALSSPVTAPDHPAEGR